MKRVGYIFGKICDPENIKKAILKSSLGKRDQKRVKQILENMDFYTNLIRNMLMEKTYVPSPYSIKTIQDGASKKIRTIHKPRYYPDQIIHWALILQIEHIIMRGMYLYSCGSVPKRGTGFAKKTLRKWLDNDPKGTKYCLKMDISKYYPSIDNEILKSNLGEKIKDQDCLWLTNTIIDSASGLPIGNYTSQWLANFFLEGLDHFIKEQLYAEYYIRYVDDLVILGTNKKKLHAIKKEIDHYLNGINLKLKDNWQVFRIESRDIDFLGYRFFRDKTILRKTNALRIRRRCQKIHKKSIFNLKDASAVISYWGWVKNSNSYRFYQNYFASMVNICEARKVISHGNKKANI